MAQPQIFEGTALEIAEQIRDSHLEGRLRAIITLENGAAALGSQETLADTLTDFLAELDQHEFTPGQPLTDPQEREVGCLIAEKFAKHGHTK